MSSDTARIDRPLLRPVRFSTESLQASQQFEAWREQCRTVIDVTEPLSARPGYTASSALWKLGPFALTEVRAEGARYHRRRDHIRRDSLDHWVISVARRGEHRIRTDSVAAIATAGTPYVFSLDEAHEGERGEIDWLCLFVARDAFPAIGPTIDAARHAPLGTAMGRLLGNYLQMLAEQLPGVTEGELPRVVEATRAMIAACVAPASDQARGAEPQVERARLARARHFIRENLRSSRLGPTRLSRLVGMSRSQLYRLFEPFGGVARYIQSERLREAHRALANPGNGADICRIGEDLGFFDASSFSRAFRREFGYSPSDLRAMALAGQPSAPIRQASMADARLDLSGVLRQL